MIEDIDCPFCKFEFQGKLWDGGFCPQCGEEYYWDERCTEDYSDCWTTVWWQRFDDLSRKNDTE